MQAETGVCACVYSIHIFGHTLLCGFACVGAAYLCKGMFAHDEEACHVLNSSLWRGIATPLYFPLKFWSQVVTSK